MGKNTLIYLAFHMGIIRFVQNLHPEVTKDYNFGLLLSVACCIILGLVSWIINKFFPYVHGKVVVNKTKLIQVGKFLCVLWCMAVPTYIAWKGFLPNVSIKENIILYTITSLIIVLLVVCVMSRYLKSLFLEK